MRIAVLIIGLIVAFVSGLQSCTVFALSSAVAEKATSASASLGVLMALLFVGGAAFVLTYPRVAAALFALGSLLGYVASQGDNFGDLAVWATGGLLLTAMSYWGSRELRNRKAAIDGGEASK